MGRQSIIKVAWAEAERLCSGWRRSQRIAARQLLRQRGRVARGPHAAVGGAGEGPQRRPQRPGPPRVSRGGWRHVLRPQRRRARRGTLEDRRHRGRHRPSEGHRRRPGRLAHLERPRDGRQGLLRCRHARAGQRALAKRRYGGRDPARPRDPAGPGRRVRLPGPARRRRLEQPPLLQRARHAGRRGTVGQRRDHCRHLPAGRRQRWLPRLVPRTVHAGGQQAVLHGLDRHGRQRTVADGRDDRGHGHGPQHRPERRWRRAPQPHRGRQHAVLLGLHRIGRRRAVEDERHRERHRDGEEHRLPARPAPTQAS